jgi:hypothetical protein
MTQFWCSSQLAGGGRSSRSSIIPCSILDREIADAEGTEKGYAGCASRCLRQTSWRRSRLTGGPRRPLTELGGLTDEAYSEHFFGVRVQP